MPAVITADPLRVVTLNLAHGRGLALNQMLQRSATTRKNLAAVADQLVAINADLVALQEADAPSRWSGNFDHVKLLAEQAGYPCHSHGRHAVKKMYAFGTALLARTQFMGTMSHDFAPSPPTTNKGFTLGQFDWNPGGRLDNPLRITVISVHLDFSRQSVRESQINEMGEHLEGVEPPVIILGDFNVDWTTDGSVLKSIAEDAGLSAWQPLAVDQATYKDGKKRLDWILISNDLVFTDHRLADELVSDHRAVFADIRPGRASSGPRRGPTQPARDLGPGLPQGRQPAVRQR